MGFGFGLGFPKRVSMFGAGVEIPTTSLINPFFLDGQNGWDEIADSKNEAGIGQSGVAPFEIGERWFEHIFNSGGAGTATWRNQSLLEGGKKYTVFINSTTFLSGQNFDFDAVIGGVPQGVGGTIIPTSGSIDFDMDTVEIDASEIGNFYLEFTSNISTFEQTRISSIEIFEQLGTIYEGSDINDFGKINPSSPTVTMVDDSGDILMTGTNGTGGTNASDLFQDMLFLNVGPHKITCLSNWCIEIDWLTGTAPQLDANSFGFSAGVVSTNDFEFRDTLMRCAQDTAFLGRMFFYYGDTSSTGIANQGAPAGGFAIQPSTNYKFRVEKDGLTLTATLLDSTGTTVHLTKSVTDAPPGDPLNKVHHNTGRFVICQKGGVNKITNIKISSKTVKNCPYAVIGDSHSYGGKVPTLSDSFPDLAIGKDREEADGDNFPQLGRPFIVTPGWADRLVDMVTRMDEIIALNPGTLVIEGGSNDIKDGVLTATWQAALDSMILQAENAGITVVNMSACARNDIDVSAIETYMVSLSQPVCLAYSVTKNPVSTALRGDLDSGDGIHLDTHVELANALRAILSLN